MSLKNFIIKCVIITGCIGFLLYMFYPRYEFIDERARFGKINGILERKSFSHGWRE